MSDDARPLPHRPSRTAYPRYPCSFSLGSSTSACTSSKQRRSFVVAGRSIPPQRCIPPQRLSPGERVRWFRRRPSPAPDGWLMVPVLATTARTSSSRTTTRTDTSAALPHGAGWVSGSDADRPGPRVGLGEQVSRHGLADGKLDRLQRAGRRAGIGRSSPTGPGGYHPPRARLSWEGRATRAPPPVVARRKGACLRRPADPQDLRVPHRASGSFAIAYYSGELAHDVEDRRAPLLPAGHLACLVAQRASDRLHLGPRLSNGAWRSRTTDGTHVREITDTPSGRPDLVTGWARARVRRVERRWARGRLALPISGRGDHTPAARTAPRVETWKDDGTLLVSTHPGGS